MGRSVGFPAIRALRCGILLAAVIAARPAGGANTTDTIVVPPTGVATWAEMLEAEASMPPPAQEEFETPFLPGPESRDLGPPPGGMPERQEPAGSAAAAAGVNVRPVPIRGFQALADPFLFIPPDTMGAAGPAHLLTMLNTQVRIQTKTGGDLGTVLLSTFWNVSGLMGDPFDPRVIYDSLSGRWIATVDANAVSTSSEVWFAISANSDPTGAWTFYSFQADPAGLVWADFPGFGVNSTWVAITQNMFTVAANAFAGAKMWVIDKSTALAGGALTVTVFPTLFDVGPLATQGFALMPAVTFDVAEPKLYIVDNFGYNSGGQPLERLSEISGTGPAPTWSQTPGGPFPGTGLFLVPPYDPSPYDTIGAEQLGVPSTCDGGANDGQACLYVFGDCPGGRCRRVDTNDKRVSISSVFRNGNVWYTHHASLPASGTPDRVAVFWFELLPAQMAATGNPIVQSGIIDGGPRTYYFYPSIAVNRNDDVCIGFSASDPDHFIAGAEATRVGTDPPGTIGTVSVIKAGEDPYVRPSLSTGVTRWGDYSNTVVDPADDLSFWTIQEYADHMVPSSPRPGRWATWWALKGRVGAGAPVLSFVGLVATVTGLLVAGMLLIRRRARR